MPCGTTHEGLPIGLQIVGRHYEDARVLALAERYERIRPFQRPPLPADTQPTSFSSTRAAR